MRSAKTDPVELEVTKDDEGFALTCDGRTLRTADGATAVRHQAAPLLEHIASEFDGQGSIQIEDDKIVGPRFFGAFGLFDIQKTWIEPGKDELSSDFAERLLCDPVLHRAAGPESVDQHARWLPIVAWLGGGFGSLARIAAETACQLTDGERLNREAAISLARKATEVVELRDKYLSLAPEQRAVVMFLHAIDEGPVLFPLALVHGKCTVAEYAQGVMASQALLAGTFEDVEDKDHRDAFEGFRSDARTGLEYVQYYREGTTAQYARELVVAGEGERQEFKSTLRWNLHTGKKDDAITHASIKTIAGFLNTSGGRLLIGVADDGEVVGIERDGFPNTDKFLLHLTNTVKQAHR